MLDRFERMTGITPEEGELLGRVSLFAGLPAECIRLLLADAWTQSYPAGTVLFLQDDPADRFYVVLSGWVKLFRETEEGEECVVAVHTAGESFAEGAIIDHGGFPAGAAVVEDSRLLVISADPFRRRLRENGDCALNLAAVLALQFRRLIDQVEALAVRSSTERLAGFLARLSQTASGPAVIRLPWNKALVANCLGMQPETLSRSLARLRVLGVRCRRGEVAIPDVSALREFGAGRPCGPRGVGPIRREAVSPGSPGRAAAP